MPRASQLTFLLLLSSGISDLDFFGTVKLVNYIRSEVKAGNAKPDVSSRSLFEDDKYMIPTLEDDALLFSLDDISDEQLRVGEENEKSDDPVGRVEELERELSRLRGEFAEYKDMVKKSLEKELNNDDGNLQGAGSKRLERAEEGYFSSYSYNSMSQCFRAQIGC